MHSKPKLAIRDDKKWRRMMTAQGEKGAYLFMLLFCFPFLIHFVERKT
jgi:hypothetical protein